MTEELYERVDPDLSDIDRLFAPRDIEFDENGEADLLEVTWRERLTHVVDSTTKKVVAVGVAGIAMAGLYGAVFVAHGPHDSLSRHSDTTATTTTTEIPCPAADADLEAGKIADAAAAKQTCADAQKNGAALIKTLQQGN